MAGASGGGMSVNTNEGGTANVTMERSTVSGCGSSGIKAMGAGTKLVITGSTVTHNIGDAVDATNNATVVISGGTFTRNTDYGFYLAGGGVIKSTGDNTVEGNTLGSILGVADHSDEAVVHWSAAQAINGRVPPRSIDSDGASARGTLTPGSGAAEPALTGTELAQKRRGRRLAVP